MGGDRRRQGSCSACASMSAATVAAWRSHQRSGLRRDRRSYRCAPSPKPGAASATC
jgi:hypothetical protein